MNGFEKILRFHAEKYPDLQPRDAVKLVYQSVFGCGHLIADEKTALERLENEYQTVPHTREAVCFEPLGDTARVYLDAPLSKEERRLFGRMFAVSAGRFPVGYGAADAETREKFEERLAEAGRVFGFPSEAWEQEVSACRAAGFPAVSHSERYREAYHPAYRVIDAKFVRLWDAMKRIQDGMLTKVPFVVSLDGRCASGKSTAAELMAAVFGGSVVRLDDFFLPPEMRTVERLAEPGGNLHRERFLDEVIPKLRDGAFAYRAFDCSTGTYAVGPRTVEAAPLVICEGSYACHPAFGQYADLRLFSTVPVEEQKRRILIRNGAEGWKRFESRWIPLEERYFEAFHIAETCDMILV